MATNRLLVSQSVCDWDSVYNRAGDSLADLAATNPACTGRDEWIRATVTSHARMHELFDEGIREARWRKECIRTAMAKGATQQMIADALGVTREQVCKLAQS